MNIDDHIEALQTDRDSAVTEFQVGDRVRVVSIVVGQVFDWVKVGMTGIVTKGPSPHCEGYDVLMDEVGKHEFFYTDELGKA
jgi:hypothetical protein